MAPVVRSLFLLQAVNATHVGVGALFNATNYFFHDTPWKSQCTGVEWDDTTWWGDGMSMHDEQSTKASANIAARCRSTSLSGVLLLLAY